MLSTFQLTVEIVAGLFFVVVAISCLLWPDKFYEHALRLHYRKVDLSEETDQNLHRRGYVWTVRIIGVIAVLMFTFTVIHFFSSMPNSHRGVAKPIPSVQNK